MWVRLSSSCQVVYSTVAGSPASLTRFVWRQGEGGGPHCGIFDRCIIGKHEFQIMLYPLYPVLVMLCVLFSGVT